MKKSIITIAGLAGSGKSTAGKVIADKLGYKHFSAGDLQRQFAERNGMSIEDLNTKAKTDPQFDKATDDENTKIGEGGERVVDARLAYYFIPDSFKVFLTIDPVVSANRVFKQIKEEGRHTQTAESVEEIIEKTKGRRADERSRFLDYYDLDIDDLSPFDLVIDTTETGLDEVVEQIIQAYKNWLSNVQG